MGVEFDALVKQGTWTLVPYNPAFHLVGGKWVYKVKQRADGTMDRFKARLVAKGYNQIHGIDYTETVSPVVKPTTVRVVLAIAVHFGWPIRQMDVHNAFLHGVLDEEVYMSQPLGFVNPTKPTHVCRMHKAIYGLKQVPRPWFLQLTQYLLGLGFHSSSADPSLYSHYQNGCVTMLLIYVDDMIVTSNNPSTLTSLMNDLNRFFAIKDLGPLYYF